MRRKIIGGGEDLQWAGDVKQLHPVEGENFDAARVVWRNSRAFCHFRQTITG